MRPITSQAELERIHESSSGYIYNDFAGMGASGKKYNVLHKAECRWVKKTTVSVPKYHFDTLDEALTWLEENRGREDVKWKRCKTCHPQAGRIAVRPARSKTAPTKSSVPPRPFTDSEVERLLVRWFKEHSYQVQTQVPVPSGIVDIVVSGRESGWIIEVKGEDRGGYTSAQMNFQMGIGQLVSRMSDPAMNYALAIPVTPDYGRVLATYRGTFGAKRLEIYFLTVERDGSVKRFAGSQLKELIEYVNSSVNCISPKGDQ